MCTLLRPVLALQSANMSTKMRALLVQLARLEHMGSLSSTAKLLGWVVSPDNASGCSVYVNESLRMVVPLTYDSYTNLHFASRVVDPADENF